MRKIDTGFVCVQREHENYLMERKGIKLWSVLLVFIGTFLVMLFVTGMLQTWVATSGLSALAGILVGSAIQGIMAFMIPSLVAARMESNRPFVRLGLAGKQEFRWYAGVVILLLLSMPAMNQIIYWNSEIHFPDSMSALESALRSWEDRAAAMTDVILEGNSAMMLISGVLVVGVLTGFAEEAFFRGGLQRIFCGHGVNAHVAIWVTAFIFSAVHFQFFGFIPRLLLGAAFGYIFLWTGSLWCAAFAHALNNSLVVISAWLQNSGLLSTDIEGIGVSGTGFPLFFAVSLFLTVVFIRYHKKFFNKKFYGSEERTRDNRRNTQG